MSDGVPGTAQPLGVSYRATAVGATGVALALLAVGLSHVSVAAFAVASLAMLALLAYAAYEWPQPVLLLAMLAPVLDRYFGGALVADELQLATRFFSEGLLALAAVVISVRAIRDGRFVPALRHGAAAWIAAFALLGLLSALVNGVPPLIAAAGILLSVDAMALFFLARMVPWERRQVRALVVLLVGMASVAAALALAQVILSPDILGLSGFQGTSGEGQRVGAFFDGNPNILGAVLLLAIPFVLAAATRSGDAWIRVACAGLGLMLLLALLFTYSRGAWMGLAVGLLVTGLLVDRRLVAVAVVGAAVAFGIGQVLPSGLLAPEGNAVSHDFFGSSVNRIGKVNTGEDLRIKFIKQGLPLLGRDPVLGVGPGRYGGAVAFSFGSPIYDELGADAPTRAVDDFWLHLVVEFGIAGVLAYLGIFADILLQIVRGIRRTAREATLVLEIGTLAVAIGLVIDSLTEMLLEGNTLSFPLWLLLGVASAMVAARAGARAAAHPAGEQSRDAGVA